MITSDRPSQPAMEAQLAPRFRTLRCSLTHVSGMSRPRPWPPHPGVILFVRLLHARFYTVRTFVANSVSSYHSGISDCFLSLRRGSNRRPSFFVVLHVLDRHCC